MSHQCCCKNSKKTVKRNMALVPYVDPEEEMYNPFEDALTPYLKAGTLFAFLNSARPFSYSETYTYKFDERGNLIPSITRKVTMLK